MCSSEMCLISAAIMSWVGCLITDSELFILFAENSQILLFPFSSCIDVSGSTESVSKQPTHLIIAAKVFTNQWLPVEESSVYDIIDGPHSIKISQINLFSCLARNLQKNILVYKGHEELQTFLTTSRLFDKSLKSLQTPQL